MPSLPTVDGSFGTWGQELNDFLLVGHNADGTIKDEISVDSVSATTYIIQLDDKGKVIEFTAATAVTVTVPANATVALPIGTVIILAQFGAGAVSFVPASGVTLNSPSGNRKIAGQYSSVSLRKRATDTWVLDGDLIA